MRVERHSKLRHIGLAFTSLLIGAGAPPLAALTSVKPGVWRLHEVDSDQPPRLLCVSDAAMLLQLNHPHAQCSRFVLDDRPDELTVRYSCPGMGNGRTTLRIESQETIRLSTQGLYRSAPFDADYEGHWLGDCPH